MQQSGAREQIAGAGRGTLGQAGDEFLPARAEGGERREVARAAIQLLARRGPRGLTLRALAEEMGGSITLVTHFFPNRRALLDAVLDYLPSPLDIPPVTGVNPRTEAEEVRHADPGEPFCALAFKIVSDAAQDGYQNYGSTGDKVLAHAMAQRMIHALRSNGGEGSYRMAERRSARGCGLSTVNLDGNVDSSPYRGRLRTTAKCVYLILRVLG